MRVIPGDGHGDDRFDADGALLRLVHAIESAQSERDVLRIAVDGIRPLVDSDCAAVVLSDVDGTLEVAATAGAFSDFSESVREKHLSLSADALAADAVLTGSYTVEREPFSLERHALVASYPGRESVRAAAAVPIHSTEGTIGVFAMFSDRDTAFGSRRMESIGTFAGIVALEIHRRRRIAAMQKERADARELLVEAKTLARIADVGDLLSAIASHCRSASNASFAIAWRLRGNLFEAAAIDGDDLGFALAAKFNAEGSSPLGQGPEGRASREGATAVVKDTHADRSYAPWLSAAQASRVRTVLALPLATSGGDPVVLGLYSPAVDAFDAATIAHLEAYGDHARAALEATRGFEAASREIRERAMAASAAGVVTRSLDLGEVARSIARAAGEAVGATFAVTYVGDRDLLAIAGGWNAPADLRLPSTVAVNDPAMAVYPPVQAAQLRRIVVASDVTTDPQWLRQGWDQQALYHGFNAVVAVPLPGASLRGVVVACSSGSLSVGEAEAAALTRLGAEGAAAIEAARRYERARSARDFLNRVLEESTDAIVQIDLRGDVIGWNAGAERMFGLSREEAVGSKFSDMSMVPPGSRDDIREMFSRVARGEQVRALEVVCRSKSGPIDMLLSATPSRDEDGNIVGVVAFSKDITEQKKRYQELLEQNRRLTAIREITRAIGREAGVGAIAQMGLDRLLETQRLDAGRIYVLEQDHTHLVNVAQRGFTAEGCEPVDAGPSTTGSEGALATAVFYRQTIVTNDVDGSTLEHASFVDRSAADVSCTMTKPLVVGDRVVGVLQTIGFDGRRLTFDDQSLLHAIADELAASIHAAQILDEASRMAITDPLTGLYNYRFAHDFLKKRLSEARRRRRPFSVIMADVDGLQAINERFGRQVGDDVLREFGRSLAACVRLSDVVARYGGDEFIVLLPETQLGDALMLAERMAQSFGGREWQKPVEELELTASMGCAAFPESGAHAQMLLKAADAALYQAKKSGRNAIFPRADSLPRFAG